MRQEKYKKYSLAIDITPLQSDHGLRGIGQVVRQIVSHVINNRNISKVFKVILVKYEKSSEFDFYNNFIVLKKTKRISKELKEQLIHNDVSIYHCMLNVLPEKSDRFKTLTTIYDIIPLIFKEEYFFKHPYFIEIKDEIKKSLLKKLLSLSNIHKEKMTQDDKTHHQGSLQNFTQEKTKKGIKRSLFSFAFWLYRNINVIPTFVIKIFKLEKYHPYNQYIAHIKKVITYSDYYHHISKTTKNDFIKYFKLVENKNHSVIYLGHTKKTMSKDLKVYETYGLEKKKYFYYMGGFDYRKNIFGLIDIYNLFLQSYKGKKFKLVIIGYANIFIKEKVIEYIKENKLEDHIIITGYLPTDEAQSLIKNSYLFLFPSLYEGFGLPVIEAAGYGIPAVVYKNSAINEIGNKVITGVKDGDMLGFAKAIISMIENKQLYNEKKKSGIEMAQLYKWEKTTENLVKLYDKILSRVVK